MKCECKVPRVVLDRGQDQQGWYCSTCGGLLCKRRRGLLVEDPRTGEILGSDECTCISPVDVVGDPRLPFASFMR